MIDPISCWSVGTKETDSASSDLSWRNIPLVAFQTRSLPSCVLSRRDSAELKRTARSIIADLLRFKARRQGRSAINQKLNLGDWIDALEYCRQGRASVIWVVSHLLDYLWWKIYKLDAVTKIWWHCSKPSVMFRSWEVFRNHLQVTFKYKKRSSFIAQSSLVSYVLYMDILYSCLKTPHIYSRCLLVRPTSILLHPKMPSLHNGQPTYVVRTYGSILFMLTLFWPTLLLYFLKHFSLPSGTKMDHSFTMFTS